MCSAKCGRKTARYLTNPKKLQTLVTKFGVSHCNIFLYLDNCGSMPHADMWWLRKSSSVKKNWHFFGFMYKCACCRACKTKSMCFSCSSKLSDCQVQENCGGNSRNSGCQVWTYEVLEGTSASAYVLHPFQTLVPRFWNEVDGVLEIRVSE